MKKTKFLMPILGIGATAATVAPMATMTACSSKKAMWEILSKSVTQDNITFDFEKVRFNGCESGYQYYLEEPKDFGGADIEKAIWMGSGIVQEGGEEDLISFTFNNKINVTTKVTTKFDVGKKKMGTEEFEEWFEVTLTFTCVYDPNKNIVIY